MNTETNRLENTKPLNKQVLRKRVAELETRLTNLHILVSNIAHNQETIVKALTPDTETQEEDDTPYDDINFNEPR